MLVRDDAHGPSVYLTRRSNRSRFMPDVYVFPGGAVDAADRDPAMLALVAGSESGAPPGVVGAALRELLEEAGVLFAREASGNPVGGAPGDTVPGIPSDAVPGTKGDAVGGATANGTRSAINQDCVTAMRAELVASVPFATLVVRRGLVLDAAPLIYYSNWITPATEPIRFDTHFFLAPMPDHQIASADAVEVHDGVWLAPSEALGRGDRGEMTIILPTRKHLERLAAFPTVEAIVAHARTRRVMPVAPLEKSPGDFAIDVENDAW